MDCSRNRRAERYTEFAQDIQERGEGFARASILDEAAHLRSADTMNQDYIHELRNVIRKLHGGDATHVESVPVQESFHGKTIWDGVVEVFDLTGHPTANRVYAWAHETDEPQGQRRHVTVLHLHPAISPQTAVRAAIIQEFRLGTTEET